MDTEARPAPMTELQMNNEQQQRDKRIADLEDIVKGLNTRTAELEDFVAGMSRRVIFARGEAMASTFSLVEVVNALGRDQTIEKFSMGAALKRAETALSQKRDGSEPKTRAAIDHAKLLLKGMQISLITPQSTTLDSTIAPS
jgi:hypothetical protein